VNELVDSLLNHICHRRGPYADLLPLCVRCSCVYAGALLGAVFEAVRLARHPGRPSQTAYWLSGTGLVLMGVVGFAGLHHVVIVPLGVKVFVALYFGSSMAVLAVLSGAHELGLATSAAVERARWRWVFLGVLVLCTVPIASGHQATLRVLGVAAGVGVVVAFVLVNLAVGLVVLRGVRTRGRRLAWCGVVVPAMVVGEFVVFAWWRGG